MAYPIIASKTDKNSWMLGAEKCSVTLTLVQLSSTSPKFGILYNAEWSGIKSGSISGGPYPVPGNTTLVVNPSPQVTLIISNYTDTGSSISLHAQINVDAPVIGKVTVFNETLSGRYPAAGLAELATSLQQAQVAAQN